MKNTFKIFFLILLITIVGCTDESKDPLPQLEKGGFIRFANISPPNTFGDPLGIEFTGEIIDPNNNASNYSLSLKANINGQTYIQENFISISSFPATLSFNSQSIADGLGVNVNTLNFTNTFDFIATVTRNDGTVFYGIVPEFDPNNLTVGIGNTEANLSTAGYNDAMAFGFLISCPEFSIDDLVGSYNVTQNNLVGGLGLSDPDPTREVIAGPGPNQITVVGGSVGFAGGGDLIVDVDTETGALSLGVDGNGYVGLAFPASIIGFASDYDDFAPGGLALPCIPAPTLYMPFTLTCCGGVWPLGLTKQ